MKVTEIEKVVGFSMLVNHIGEKELIGNGHYKGGTHRNRKELYQQLPLIITKG
ncbi:hypothetical protein [Bacillus sp. V5-8f]|uniref:hypothetical protein n=1 Tax=Bacillus sp. V5-8f TaxID=2053044 RepID=UPI0015E11DD5|nr:hypothetical protein [Bacillus sp. V5-8f]